MHTRGGKERLRAVVGSPCPIDFQIGGEGDKWGGHFRKFGAENSNFKNQYHVEGCTDIL